MRCNRMFAKLLIALVVLTAGAQQLFAEDLDSRKQRIDQMTAIEKDELRGKQKRFESLSSEDQDKYRTLHQELEQRENGERLQTVMKSYYNWLKSLDTVQRNELQELSAEERIDKIKQFMDQQEREQFRELAAEAAENIKREDFEVIKQWIKSFVEKHQEEIWSQQKDLPEHFRKFFDGMKHLEPGKRAYFLWTWMLKYHQKSIVLPQPEDLEELTAKMRPETKEMLGKMKEDERHRVMWGLIRAAVYSSDRKIVSEDELLKFHETLPPDVKSTLALLTPDEFKQQLKMEFAKRKFYGGGGPRGPGGRRPSFGPWPGRPPGFGGPGPGGDGRGPRNGPGGENNRPPRGGGPGPDNRGPVAPKTAPPKQEEA